MPGLVPKFYELAACKAANYQFFHNWQELTSDQQAILIAHYFGENIMESHKNDALSTKMEQDSKKKGKKR